MSSAFEGSSEFSGIDLGVVIASYCQRLHPVFEVCVCTGWTVTAAVFS